MLELGLAVAGQNLGAVLRRLPHPWALGEDLDDLGSDLRTVLQSRNKALTCSYVGPYQHVEHRTSTVFEAIRRKR